MISHDIGMNLPKLNISALPPLHEPDIKLWLVDLALPMAHEDWAVLSPPEQDRAARFRFDRDARRYRTSHAALRQILGGVLDMAPAALAFVEGSHGKPRLLDDSAPPLHFNMSHSGEWALIGVSMERPIGVDLEVITPMDDAELLAQKNFSAAEQAAFLRTPADQRLEAFFRCWTRKEACLKALGSGLSIEPHEFEAGLDGQPRDTAILVDGHSWAMQVRCVDLPIKGLAAVAQLAAPHSPSGM